MHDGSFHCDLNLRPNSKTYSEACAINALEKVIDHYMSGGKTPSNKNTNLIRPFSLTNIEKQDLINFLLSLTDQEFISNPKFSNPF
jgi:cytochrome c peroxidase